jgi:hypothetical protein
LLFVSLSGGNIESRKLGLRGGKGGTAVLTTENPSSLPDNFDIWKKNYKKFVIIHLS